MASKRIKFLHCADIHIDFPFFDRGNEGYSHIRRQDVKETFESIINLSVTEKVDFILISGDLYEHSYSSKASIGWISGLFETLSIPVVIIPGNHDPYTANSWYKAWGWPENVTVLTGERPFITLETLDTFVYGIGFSAFNQDKPDLSVVNAPDPGKFNILMYHGTLDMDIGRPYNPVTSDELSRLGFDYYALGHFHNRVADFRIKNAGNPGSPEPLGFDEKGDHGVLLVTLERGEDGIIKFDADKRVTARREYVEQNTDITQCRNSDEIKNKIADLLSGLDGERHLTRITLKGRTDCAIDAGALEKELSEGRRYLRIRNESRNNFDYEACARENTLKGAFAREILGRIKKCEEMGDNERIPILTAALELGMEALEAGRIERSFD